MLEEKEYSKEFDFSIWKKLLGFAKPYKKEILHICLYMVGMAGFDALYPLISKYAIDTFVTKNNFQLFPYFCIFFIGMIFLQCFFVRKMIITAENVAISVPNDIRKALFNKLQTLPLAFYDRSPVGWLMARMTSDVKNLGRAMSWNLVDFVWSLSMMTIMIIVMLCVNWFLALIVLATVPILYISCTILRKIILEDFRKARKLNAQMTGVLNEGIMGAKTLKTLTREEESLCEFKTLTNEMKRFCVRASTAHAIFTPVLVAVGSVSTGFVLWQGGVRVSAGSITLGTLIAFIAYTTQFFNPVRDFTRVFNDFQYAQASGERVIDILDMRADIQDSLEVREKYGGTKEKWPETKGDISFKNVSFSYKDGEDVLDDFSLDIKAGQMVALVGETGSGKTTIVNLLCRFYQPASGEICIDGVNYKERPLLWLYSQLGYVLQEPHLFSASVRENIAYGKPDATDEEVQNAAKTVGAHEFIMSLEHGYDTKLGERGSRLSTGQKQLISFARAIITNPKLFILDEATSSVDTETEELIKKAISKILKGRTSFIIAHRLSTIRSADLILVIEKGKIIERGTHRELLNKKGYYYNLYTNQFMEESRRALLIGSDRKSMDLNKHAVS